MQLPNIYILSLQTCCTVCGNKMRTRYNKCFYCRSYCLLNMFRAPLCPSSGAQEYYTVVAACGISCCGFQVAGLVWSWGLCVRFAGCCSILQTTHNPQLHTRPATWKPLLHLVGILFPHIHDIISIHPYNNTHLYCSPYMQSQTYWLHERL